MLNFKFDIYNIKIIRFSSCFLYSENKEIFFENIKIPDLLLNLFANCINIVVNGE